MLTQSVEMGSKKRTLTAIFIILFLDTFGYALLFPSLFLNSKIAILPIDTKETTFHILLSIMLMAYPLTQFFGATFFGNISDHYGRKKILSVTILGTIIGDICSALSLYAQSYTLLLLSQLFTGFFAANLGICMAVFADIFGTKKARGKAFCFVAAILGFSWMISFFLVVLFNSPKFNYHPATPFWCFALFSLISLIIFLPLVKETAPTYACTRQKLLARDHLRMLYLIIFFWSLGLFISFQWLSPISFIKFKVTENEILLLFLSIGTFWILSALLLGYWMVSRFSLWKVSLWMLFFISLFLFFAGTSDYFSYFIITYSLSMIFAALVWGIVLALTSMAAKAGEQGRVMGLIQSMFALSKLLAPFIGGIIVGISLNPLLYCCAFLIFVAFILLLINVIRRSNRDLLIQH